MERQPLQGDQRARGPEPAFLQPGERGRERQDMGLDVLAMLGEPEQPAGVPAVDPADERLADLAAAARARIVAADRDQIEQLEAGLLDRLAPRDLGRALARLDHAGDRLEHPGLVRLLDRADPELLDEHHLPARRIVGQHDRRVAAHQQLARQFRPHAAGEQAVAQPEADHLEEARERHAALEHHDPRTRARGLVNRLDGNRASLHQGLGMARSPHRTTPPLRALAGWAPGENARRRHHIGTDFPGVERSGDGRTCSRPARSGTALAGPPLRAA